MFCPNCGTQNPEAAQTCSKCGFHLKSVAAPKFKGTMLMMNQSVSTPPPPAPGPRMSSSVPPPGAPAQRGGSGPPGAPPMGIPSKLKGTMVGVAPMAGPVRGPSPVAVPPAGAPYLAGPPAPGAMPPVGESGSAFSPPFPQAGVNPLGGTVAAENPSFPIPYAPPGAPSPYAAPPGRVVAGTQLMPGVGPGGAAYSPYPPPTGGPGPALPFPPPPHDEPAPAPNPYGARPPNAYGPPGYGGPSPQGGFAPSPSPPAPLAPYGGEGGALSTSTPPSVVIKKRNALLTWLLPGLVVFGGALLSIVLAVLVNPLFTLLGVVVVLAGALWSFLLAVVMIGEVKSVTRNRQFGWFPALLVPFYSMYWAWILVPQEVARAKQLRGVQRPPQSILLYIFLWHFALASDLNELAA